MSQPIQQGGRLGRYQLITRLATGGMAEVWLARATGAKGFQKTIVVKTILPHLADDPDFLRMFIDEALLAAALNHPNVVQIFDLGQIGEHYFIAMEFILGRTMRQVQRVLRKQRKVMPPWLVLRVAVAVCDALDYAHNRRGDDGELLGIVHRDVTPENIMISFSGVTKVVDFGIAKASTSASVTRAGKIKGKLAYLAPEQILNAGKSPADRRTDIYSLGVLLYEMLTGVRPFRAPNDMALLLKIPKEVPTAPSEIARWVPTRLSNIVMKAMDKDPLKRYQNAIDLGEELEAFLTSVGTYPSERHVSAYMCKLFDEEERRIPILSTGIPSTGSGTEGSERKSKPGEISGPDSAASISIEVSFDQTVDKTALQQTGENEEPGASEASDEDIASHSRQVAQPESEEPAAEPEEQRSGEDAPQPAAEPEEQRSGEDAPQPAAKSEDQRAEEAPKSANKVSESGDFGLDLGSLGDSWGSSELPGVEAPQPASPSLEMPSVPAPSVPAPSVPAPSVPAPSVPAPSVPAPSPAKTESDDSTSGRDEEGVSARRDEASAKDSDERALGSDPFITQPSRTTAWDAIVERTMAIDASEAIELVRAAETAGEEAEGAAGEAPSAPDEGPRHAWDAVVSRSLEVEEVDDEDDSEDAEVARDERESPAPVYRDEKLHMWDAFIRSRSGNESGQRTPLFPTTAETEQTRRESAWWTGQGGSRAEAASKFDEGLEHVRQGRHEEALLAWEQAVTLEPENRKYQGNLRMLKKSLSHDDDHEL